jgi:transcriptional regulator with XRE-family HTH domain
MTTEEMSQFKALIRETTVYNYYAELKDAALTEEGYVDLIKVPDLRVAGIGQFLKKLRLEKELSQSKFAKLLNVTRSRLNHWERNDRTISLQLLVKIAERYGISKTMIYSLMDQGIFETKNALPVKFEQISEIIGYFSPQESGDHWRITILNGTNEILAKIKSLLNVNIQSYPYGKRIGLNIYI